MPETPDAREELRRLLLEKAFRFGDFVLSSGRHSDFYFDGRQVTLHGRGLYLVTRMLHQRCVDLGADAIAGLTLGADPLVAAVIAHSGETGTGPQTGIIVRKAAKDHGTGRLLEGPAVRPGQRVVLVDDTTTTGSSYIAAAAPLREAGAEVTTAFAIVDRQEGAAEALREHGLTLEALYLREEFPAPAATEAAQGA